MPDSLWKSNLLGLVSVALSVIAFVNEQDRLLVAILCIGAIVFYMINSVYNDIDESKEKINRLEDNLKINNQLVSIKGDIEYLKKEVHKK